MKYSCIDFETANNESGSVCSVGIVCVNSGVIEKEFYSLVNPETWFDVFCSQVHGLSELDVRNAPRISEILASIEPILIEYETLVAHYAAFDMRHLIGAYHRIGRPLPQLKSIICTRTVSRRAFPNRISYSLPNLTDLINFKYDAHNALGDAKACNALLGACIEITKSSTLEELCEALHIRSGSIIDGTYVNCAARNHSSSRSKLNLSPASADFDESNPFYGQEVVFTGTLSSATRAEAAQSVVNVGGIFAESIRKTTNFLVLGMQDLRKFNGGIKSSKMIKAENMLASGESIEIIGEDEFWVLLGNKQ